MNVVHTISQDPILLVLTALCFTSVIARGCYYIADQRRRRREAHVHDHLNSMFGQAGVEQDFKGRRH